MISWTTPLTLSLKEKTTTVLVYMILRSRYVKKAEDLFDDMSVHLSNNKPPDISDDINTDGKCNN